MAGNPRCVMVAIILLGAFIRWYSLGSMTAMLHHDEAYNAVDALELIQSPRFTPVLAGNFGRESGWIYWLIPFLLGLGPTSFAVRMAATMTGLMTIAATYRAGTELFGRPAGVWAAGILALFYWHIQVSNLALRANLYLLLGTLAAGTVMLAYRRNQGRAWVAAGLCAGLLAYSYFASIGLLAALVTSLSVIMLLDDERRVGAATALASAVLIWVPMFLFIAEGGWSVLARPAQVVQANLDSVLLNARQWGRAWFVEGDPNALFNLPGRPILDLPLGVLFGAGIGLTLFRSSQARSRLLLALAWLMVAWAPSLMSDRSPHFLRASGMMVPIAVIAGGGIPAAMSSQRQWISRVLLLVGLTLLTWSGINAFRDFHREWVNHPELFLFMEMPINLGSEYVASHTDESERIYFSPLNPGHPVVRFQSVRLAPRRVSAFDSHQCQVISDQPATYISMTLYEPDFEQRLSQWMDVGLLFQDASPQEADQLFSVFAATPRPQPGGSPVDFEGRFEMRVLKPLSPKMRPGDEIEVVMGIRPLSTPPDIYPSAFVHLYGTPTPYEGGQMWSQADSQICASYPAHLWQPGEMIVQSLVLTIPESVPSGDYTVAAGMYTFPDARRLAIDGSQGSVHDYVELSDLQVR